jgi:hypothetical protein
MSVLGQFEEGECVLYRGIFAVDSGAEPPVVCDVRPVTVVRDDSEAVRLWLPMGTPTKLCRPLDPAQLKPWLAGEWGLFDAEWAAGDALFIERPGT